MTSVSYPDGNKAIYARTQGAVSSVTYVIGGSTVAGASAITYRPMDMGMTNWTSSNGLTNTLSYDTDGRLTGISVPATQSLTFAYDSANRLQQLNNGMYSSLSQTFSYDAQSQLSTVTSGADNESYAYDADGNRTSQMGTADTVSATSNQLLSSGSNVYGYDALGNTTTVAGVQRYYYDAFNRMVSAAGTSYYVNPEGQRLSKVSSTAATYFAPDSSNAMLAENAGAGWIDYVWLNGRLIGRLANGQAYAVNDDQVGRPESVTGPTQAVVWHAQNFPFTQVVTTSTIAMNLGFPGQYYDSETSAWNNGFRDYKSGLGRYLESDPIGLNGGINTYTYVGDNPLSYTDLLGLSPDCSTYWDRYMDFVSDHAINVGPAAAALAGGLWPKSLAPAGGFRGPLLGSSNPLTSVPRAFGMPGGGSSVMRGGAAVIGLATVGIGMYDATIEVEGFVYAAKDAPPPSAKCDCGK